jgi:hypothetical protein
MKKRTRQYNGFNFETLEIPKNSVIILNRKTSGAKTRSCVTTLSAHGMPPTWLRIHRHTMGGKVKKQWQNLPVSSTKIPSRLRG